MAKLGLKGGKPDLVVAIGPEKDDSEDPALLAAEGLLSAVQAGDAAGVADALRIFLDASRSEV